MRCETGALIECHKHEFHCVVAYHINVRDTAILIWDKILKLHDLAWFDNFVHIVVLLFYDDFGVNTAGFCCYSAEYFRRDYQHITFWYGMLCSISSDKKISASFCTDVYSGIIVGFLRDWRALSERKIGYGCFVTKPWISWDGHLVADRA